MKNIKLSILALLGVFSLVGCDRVMDTKPMDSYDETTVWGSRSTADAFVRGLYNTVLGKYYGTGAGNALFERRSPNLIGTVDGHSQKAFCQEEISATNDDFNLFGNYGNIRSINMIIKMAQQNNGKGLSDVDTKELTAQALFLRAMLYYPMARATGHFVFIDKVLDPADTTADGLKRYILTPTIEESYNIIIKDLEAAIPDLTKAKTSGLPNKYAACALMTDVCLTAAAYQPDATKRKGLLQKVVQYADLLVSEGGYALYDGNFGDMFNENWQKAQSEIILANYRDVTLNLFQNTDMQVFCPNANNDQLDKTKGTPLFKIDKRFEAWGAMYPTQNLSDAYLMVDQATGKAVKWYDTKQVKDVMNQGAISSKPTWATLPDGQNFAGYDMGVVQYSGAAKDGITDLTAIMYGPDRDARLASTLVLDNSEWFGETVRTRYRGNLGRYSADNVAALGYYRSWTNLYLRKGFYNTVQGNALNSSYTAYHWVAFRLGRVVLNKAEAQLWLAREGEGSYSDAVATFNQTRTKHGKLPASSAASSTDAWADYITERRAELAYEGGDFYWSALRWGLHGGDANQGQPAGAVGKSDGGKAMWLLEQPTYIEISPNGTEFYVATVTYEEHNKREFRADRRYLLPINANTLQAYPFLGKQNPGW